MVSLGHSQLKVTILHFSTNLLCYQYTSYSYKDKMDYSPFQYKPTVLPVYELQL